MIALAMIALTVALVLLVVDSLLAALVAHWIVRRVQGWVRSRFMVPPILRRRT